MSPSTEQPFLLADNVDKNKCFFSTSTQLKLKHDSLSFLEVNFNFYVL